MRDWKKIGKKLLFPPVWIIALLTVICTVSLVVIFINGWEMNPFAYVSYVLSFYTLTVVCIFCWKVLPGFYKSAKSKMHKNKYIDRYMTDAVFKSNVGLYRSLAINQSHLCHRKCSIGIYISDILVCHICGILCNHSNDEIPISEIRDLESDWL